MGTGKSVVCAAYGSDTPSGVCDPSYGGMGGAGATLKVGGYVPGSESGYVCVSPA